MKTCPICKARCFDDMQICYGCMHRFDKQEVPSQSVIECAELSGLGEIVQDECEPEVPRGEASARICFGGGGKPIPSVDLAKERVVDAFETVCRKALDETMAGRAGQPLASLPSVTVDKGLSSQEHAVEKSAAETNTSATQKVQVVSALLPLSADADDAGFADSLPVLPFSGGYRLIITLEAASGKSGDGSSGFSAAPVPLKTVQDAPATVGADRPPAPVGAESS